MIYKKNFENIESKVEMNILYFIRKCNINGKIIKEKIPFYFLGEHKDYKFFLDHFNGNLVCVSKNLNESNRLIFGNTEQLKGKVIDNIKRMKKDKELSLFLNSFNSLLLFQAPSIYMFSNTLIFKNIYGCTLNLDNKLFVENIFNDLKILVEGYNDNKWVSRFLKIKKLNEIES